jgi:hypothetical protein
MNYAKILIAALVLIPSSARAVPSIFEAAKAGDLAAVGAVLAADPSQVNAADKQGCTPLFFAARSGSLPLVRFLLEKGASVEGSGRGRLNGPLFEAAADGQLEIAALLVSHGAAVDGSNRADPTPLWAAAANERIDVARYLLGRGASVDSRSPGGNTPLAAAALEGYENRPMVDLLLKAGANPKGIVLPEALKEDKAVLFVNRPSKWYMESHASLRSALARPASMVRLKAFDSLAPGTRPGPAFDKPRGRRAQTGSSVQVYNIEPGPHALTLSVNAFVSVVGSSAWAVAGPNRLTGTGTVRSEDLELHWTVSGSGRYLVRADPEDPGPKSFKSELGLVTNINAPGSFHVVVEDIGAATPTVVAEGRVMSSTLTLDRLVQGPLASGHY